MSQTTRSLMKVAHLACASVLVMGAILVPSGLLVAPSTLAGAPLYDAPRGEPGAVVTITGPRGESVRLAQLPLRADLSTAGGFEPGRH